MSKKKAAPKKVKKNIKSAKKPARPAGGKPAKPVAKSVKAKPAKKVASKPTRPTGGKPSKSSKPVKKSDKLAKTKAKKVVVPSKKKAAQPSKPLRAVKAKKVAKPVAKKLAKPARPAVGKAVKPLKSNKIIKKPAGKVAVVKSKAPQKTLKPEKAVVLALKTEKPQKIKVPKEKKPRGKGGRKPKRKDGEDDEPEIVHDELIEQLIQSTKKKKSGPKVPKILKTFVNPMTSLTVAPSENGKKAGSIPKKEPKGKFELEYVIRTSAGILYEFITTPSGLSEWFADDVNIRDGIFTFFWDGSEQKAKLLGFKEEKFIRLSWVDKPEGMYFEFRIEKDELTGDISLIIIDFADEAADMQTSKLLWDSQVNKLLGVLGSN